MFKSPKVIVSLVMGFLVAALVAGFSIAALGQPSASAATDNQAATTTAATTTAAAGTNDKTAKNTDKTQLRDAFKKAFAANLGVDPSKLDSAFTGAVDQTVDQAVKDGKLTQDQANKIKDAAKNGFQGKFGNFGRGKGFGNFGPGRGQAGAFMQGTIDAAAKALGITSDQLKSDVKAGQSIADIAKAQNKDLQTVKTAILTSIKSDLDTSVKNGKLTQAQADQIYQGVSSRIDNIVNGSLKDIRRGK